MARRGQSRSRRRNRPPKPRLKGIPQSERVKVPPAPPKRTYECPLTRKPISNILTAIAHPDSQQPVEFDAVLEQLRQTEDIGPNERIVYLGEGYFAVVEEKKEKGKYRLNVTRKIPYEDNRAKLEWRQELSPGISRDYKPEPEHLSELYTDEETREFPRFDIPSGAYLTRSN